MIPHPQSALIEPFDSFWKAPDDIESGYERFGRFGLADVEVFGLDLYGFPANPLNWVAKLVAALFTAFFRASFVLYGKKNRIFTKKIGAVARRKP